MHTSRLIGSLAALWTMTAAGWAFVSTEYVDPAEGFVASKSRDDVRRELVAAQADGSAASCKTDGLDNARLCNPVPGRSSKLAREATSDTSTTQRTARPENMPATSRATYSGR